MRPEAGPALAELHGCHASAREELLDLVDSRNLAKEVRLEDLRDTSGPFLTALRRGSEEPSEGPRVHVVLQGPAGVGKTHLAESLRQVLSGEAGVQIRRGGQVDGEGQLVLWIAVDGSRPEGAPASAPVVRVRGLSSLEKRRLLVDRLVPRISQAHGIDPRTFAGDAILECLLRGGIQEAGLAGAIDRLERLCRRRAREISEGRKRTVDPAWLASVLGVEAEPLDPPARRLPPGSVHAPMVSSRGGAIARVEAFSSKGRGRLVVTGAGALAEISCKVARTRILELAPHLPMPAEGLRELDWHVHVSGPAGPKDGASLGWAILVAMVSHLSGTVVDAASGFTGELLLSGELASVGFVEEKFLACEREGFSRLWMPDSNCREVPADTEVRGRCETVGVRQDLAALKALGLISRRM